MLRLGKNANARVILEMFNIRQRELLLLFLSLVLANAIPQLSFGIATAIITPEDVKLLGQPLHFMHACVPIKELGRVEGI